MAVLVTDADDNVASKIRVFEERAKRATLRPLSSFHKAHSPPTAEPMALEPAPIHRRQSFKRQRIWTHMQDSNLPELSAPPPYPSPGPSPPAPPEFSQIIGPSDEEHTVVPDIKLQMHRWVESSLDNELAASDTAPPAVAEPLNAAGAHLTRRGSVTTTIKSKRSIRKANQEAAWREATESKKSEHSLRRRSSVQEDEIVLAMSHGRLPRPLPDALVWPNPEVMLLSFFAGGVVEASASVLSASAVNAVEDNALIVLAATCLVGVIAFYVHQGMRLLMFMRRHRHEVIRFRSPPVESVREVDDPLLRTLALLRLARPGLRIRGQIESPEEDAQEPLRTVRHVTNPLGCRRRAEAIAGDDQARLYSWLVDASPTTTGFFYQFIRSVSTALIAFVVGLGAGAGKDTHGIALSIVVLHVGVAAFCFFSPAPGDRLDALTSGVEMVAGGLNIFLLYLAGYTTVQPGADSAPNTANITIAGVGNVKVGAPLQDAALAFALLAVVVPLALNFYDCIFLQAYEAYALSTPEERKGGFAMFALRSLVITPVVFSAAFVSGGSSLSAAATVVEDVADNTIETSARELFICPPMPKFRCHD